MTPPNKPAPSAPPPAPPNKTSGPSAFPLDADWLTLLHDKGQLCSAPALWVDSMFAHKLAQGDDPIELACRFWTMALLSASSAQSRFAYLIEQAPEAAEACFDAAKTQTVFARFAAEFSQASLDWTPPSDPALRGWSHVNPDEDIQTRTRSKYATLALLCAQAAQAGLPEVLRMAALRRPGFVAFDAYRQLGSAASLPISATSMILLAKPLHSQPSALWGPSEVAELLSACCANMAPAKFRKALIVFAPELAPRASLAGEAIARAIRLQRTPSTIDPSAASNPVAPSFKYDHDFQRHRRIFLALGHFTNVAMASDSEARTPAFFNAILRSAEPNATPQERFDAFISLCAIGNPHLSAFAAAMGQWMSESGEPLRCAPAIAEIIWAGHIPDHKPDASDFILGLGIPSSPKGYTARHLALGAYFPHPSCESLSRDRASSDALAQIEAGELALEVPRFAPDSSWRDETDGDEGVDGAPEPARAPRKLRL